MNRREFARSAFSVASLAMVGSAAAADKKPSSEAAASSAKPAPASGRYSAVAESFAACAGAAAVCVGHCQQSLATGDTMLAECLKTSLACDASCNAVAKLARLNSDFTPAFAKQAVPVMQACVDACKPHITHHEVCKACYDACNAAISAAKGLVA